MASHADLEIGLHRWDEAGHYALEMRFNQPGSDAEVRIAQESAVLLKFDFAALRACQYDAAQYGRLLADSLFAPSVMREKFAAARASAQGAEVPLRLRLFINKDAKELHKLRWETLRDPADPDSLLFANEQILFSRFVASVDFRPVYPLVLEELRALIVVANPGNLQAYAPNGRGLYAIDAAGEVQRARDALGLAEHQITTLAEPCSATLDNIATHLREGYDILYLCCHGAFIEGRPRLWLEDLQGNAAVTAGGELVRRIRELKTQPRLVVLASCQSAGGGHDDDGALAALGPRLAEAGTPAVLAMQGQVSLSTIAGFMPVFFRELQRDGQVDRAVALARGQVREHDDFWMPTLFMRLRSGRIWYAPGLEKGFEKWDALLNHLRWGHCTPILGPGLLDHLLGSAREIAQRWASSHHVPFRPESLRDLSQVAQYLLVQQDFAFPRDEFVSHLCQEIARRYGRDMAQKIAQSNGKQRDAGPHDLLGRLLTHIGGQRRAEKRLEPHRVLAHLPCPIYITTNADNLLREALNEAGKAPSADLCPWTEELEEYGLNVPDFQPTPETPLVYHLFGRFEHSDSLVLTEDDYFDYLLGTAANKELIPETVRRAKTDSALLFLGFQIDDWRFRALLRSLTSHLMNQGRQRRKRYAHVAVQIDPQESHIVEPEMARRYLERYFQNADISIYLGSTESFLEELHKRWLARYQKDFLP